MADPETESEYNEVEKQKKELFTCVSCANKLESGKNWPEMESSVLEGLVDISENVLLLCNNCLKNSCRNDITDAIQQMREKISEQGSEATDQVFYREYEYVWTIEEYSRIRHFPRGLAFMAPFFQTIAGSVTEHADAQWSWGVLPTNTNTGKEGFLSVFVRLRNFDVFRNDHSDVTAKVSFKILDGEGNAVAEKFYNKGVDVTNWAQRDGANVANFVTLEKIDQILSKEGAKDELTFVMNMKVKSQVELSELQRDKKVIEYKTNPSVEKFTFQHRIQNYLEMPKCDNYVSICNFTQTIATGKVAIWEAFYRRSQNGAFGMRVRLVNGYKFGDCEVVVGLHLMVVNKDGSCAAQAGQRMRDDWNLGTVKGGWGRDSLYLDEQIIENKDTVLDDGALIVNYTLYLNNSTHERKSGKVDLGKATLDGSKNKNKADKKVQLMLSYNWDTKPTVQKIKEKLEEWGYKTWIDDNQMGDNVMLSMAEGVFNSDAVVVCLTDKYQNSFNCQREASMTFDERKPMIPLKLEPGVEWKPWVKLMISGKRYIELQGQQQMDEFFKTLKDYLDRMEDLKK